MKKEISIKILDIELVELVFKKKVRKQKFSANTEVVHKIKEDNIVEFDCNFEFKMQTTNIKGKYLYEIYLENIEEIEIEDFIQSELKEVLRPVLSKMSSQIAKTTDEINPFPFIIPIELWEIEEKEE